MKLAFEEHGSGKPVVLLHAFPLSRKMWQPQIDGLKSKNYRIILPDLRGFGESHNFSDITSMHEMARDVFELLEALKIDKAVIGGLSMGGYVLFEMFRSFPDKFAAAVLCDTTFLADDEDKKESRFDLVERIEKNGSQVLIEELLPSLISDFTKTHNGDLKISLEKMFAEANPKAACGALRGIALRKDSGDILKNFSFPTTLIFGAEDKITNLDAAENLLQKLPSAKLSVIENAGHYSNLEQPERFNSVLAAFVDSVNL